MEIIGEKAELSLFVSISRKSLDLLTRKAVAWSLLVCFCVAIFPLPLPSFEIASSELTESYPCKGGACGCKTAEQCWTSCCCNSPSQRLAWAVKRNVTPPAYAVLEDTVEENGNATLRPIRKAAPASQSSSCCSKKSASESVRSCCKKQPTVDTKVAKNGAVRSKTVRSLVVSMLASKCQGKMFGFTQLPWMLPSLRIEPIPAHDSITTFLQSSATTLVSITRKPETPPPKFCFL